MLPGKTKTVQGYIDILMDLLLAFYVPVFKKRAQRDVIRHPKFYFFDPGVFHYLRPKGPLDRPEEMEGFCFGRACCPAFYGLDRLQIIFM